MSFQHVENLLRRFRGENVHIKTRAGSEYEGVVMEITNDYVALKVKVGDEDDTGQLFVTLHSIEAIRARPVS